MVLHENDNQEGFDCWLLEIGCGPLRAVIIGELVGKRCRTGAKIGCSMDDAANLADQDMQAVVRLGRRAIDDRRVGEDQHIVRLRHARDLSRI